MYVSRTSPITFLYEQMERESMKGLKPAIFTFGVISSFTTPMAESVVGVKGHLWCLRCLEMVETHNDVSRFYV